MSIRSPIRTFETGTYAVTRTTAGSYTDGRYTPGAQVTENIPASIQPATGNELQNLPEAQEGHEVRAFYCIDPVYTRSPNRDPDIVSIDGEDWTVIRVEAWPRHYRALIARRINT